FERDFEYDYLDGTEFVIYAPSEGKEITANVYDTEANKVFTITAVRHGDSVEVSYTNTDKSFSVKVAGGEAVTVNPTTAGKVIIKL
ncbi:MAG: alpha-xylosidase, partial [Oscillospiraceae bacterium]|nr:alpha-xylosidase [Oscillospiraceae bacterium]